MTISPRPRPLPSGRLQTSTAVALPHLITGRLRSTGGNMLSDPCAHRVARSMAAAQEAEAFFAANPCDIHDLPARVAEFVAAQQAAGRLVACVTSGGTTVPLERNCVRFIDNFSRGTRGALSVEQFVEVRKCPGQLPSKPQSGTLASSNRRWCGERRRRTWSVMDP